MKNALMKIWEGSKWVVGALLGLVLILLTVNSMNGRLKRKKAKLIKKKAVIVNNIGHLQEELAEEEASIKANDDKLEKLDVDIVTLKKELEDTESLEEQIDTASREEDMDVLKDLLNR